MPTRRSFLKGLLLAAVAPHRMIGSLLKPECCTHVVAWTWDTKHSLPVDRLRSYPGRCVTSDAHPFVISEAAGARLYAAARNMRRRIA
jgi:hypothetical protein